MTVTFRVLGAVEASRDGAPVALSGKPLALLACLLVRANRTVSIDALAAVLWGETGGSGKGAIQTYVRRLRRAVGDEIVQTTGTGYRVDAGPDELDLIRFQTLLADGDRAAAAGDHASAGERFGQALALWRGPALAGVDSEVLQREDAAALAEQRLGAWQRWADARLRVGATPIAELTRLTAEHPLHEPFWEQLMTALHRAGRTADALAAYRQVSSVLAEELGLDPGPALQQLHQAILVGEVADAPAEAPAAAAVVPRQLSAAIDGFSGRGDELAQLAKLRSAGTGTAAVIAVIEGTAGVGKTTLAVRFAHDVADQFPDGQIQLNLRGHGPGEPMSASAALESLLRSVGVGGEMPAELDARSALWRTHTAGRRLLVLVDNARGSDQVRPLLPGAGCLVLITSRSRLPGLTAREGAGRVSLDRLSESDALDLLAKTVGADRVHADRAAARQFVARCAHLPLAIRILGEYADQRPERPLAAFVDEIDTGPDRLAYFDLDDGDDTDLRAIFARSYIALDQETARLFRRLGLHPGRDFGEPAAAALAERPLGVTQRLLDRLVRAHLLEQHQPARYELHDLLREFATSLNGDEQETVRRRALDWYVHSTLHVYQMLRPGWLDDVPAPPPGLALPEVTDQAGAMRWYAGEHDNLLATVGLAADLGRHREVCQLVLALGPYFHHVPVRDGWFATHEIALESARTIGYRRAEGRLLCSLGVAHVRFGEPEVSLAYCESALAIARELEIREDEFAALNDLGLARSHLAETEAATGLFQQALAVATQLDGRRQLIAHCNLAECYIRLERYDDAIEHAQSGLALSAESSDPVFRSHVLLSLAGAQAAGHDYEASFANLQDSLALAREGGTRLTEADVLEKMGDVRAETGDPGSARQRYEEALDLLVRLGHRNADRVRDKLAALRS